MVRPDRARLSGNIEVEEIYLRNKGGGICGRGAEKKSTVEIAAEQKGTGLGRIQIRRFEGVSHNSRIRFVQEARDPGSLVHTNGCSGLSTNEYQPKITTLNRTHKLASEILLHVDRVVLLLKWRLSGPHPGAFGPIHFDNNPDKITFRFNRRRSKNRGNLFCQLVPRTVEVDPVSWLEFAAGGRPKII